MIYDIIGILGVIMILIAYALVQLGKLHVKDLSYSLLNAIGAFFILISLLIDFNLSVFLMEFFWLIFSILGIYTYIKNKNTKEKNE